MYALSFGGGVLYGYGVLQNKEPPLATAVPFLGTISAVNSIVVFKRIDQSSEFTFSRTPFSQVFILASIGTLSVFGLGYFTIQMAKPLLKNRD